jgi:SulP family sulfate permease
MTDDGAPYDAEHPPFRPAAEKPLLQRAVPVSGDLRVYKTSSLRRDVLAGITVAALAIPSSIAYAQLAGLPPVVGLYALLLPTLAFATTASSRRLMIGPEAATATLTGVAIAPIVAADPSVAAAAAAALALLVAGWYFVARLARLGWIADYLSRPVLIGYLHGIAFVLITGQLAKLTGLSLSATRPVQQIVEVLREWGDISWTTFSLGLAVLAVLFALKRWLPKVPGALIVVVASIACSYWFDFAAHGIALVGNIPSGLPSGELPKIPAADLKTLVLPALGIFAVGFSDSILTARSYAGRHMEHVRANQELGALGIAAAVSGLTQGMPVSGSTSRTAVADSMGARTQVAALVSAGTVGAVLLFLTAPIAYLPATVLGAIIIFAGFGLINPDAWRELARNNRREFVIALVTTACVIGLGILHALVIAVVLSILDVVNRSARPHDAVLGYVPRLDRWANVEVHTSARIEPGVVVYRLDDRLFFANAAYVTARVHEAIAGAPTPTRCLVFDAESVISVDSTGLEALHDLADDLRRHDITLVVARMRGRIDQQLQTAGVKRAIGPENFYATVRAAVAACAASE